MTDEIEEIGSENKTEYVLWQDRMVFLADLAEEEKQQFSVGRSEARLPGFESLLCQLLAVLPWVI